MLTELAMRQLLRRELVLRLGNVLLAAARLADETLGEHLNSTSSDNQ